MHRQLGSCCCIASGTISQGNSRFRTFSRNSQCVCISVATCAYIENVQRDRFTSQIIDNLIETGDAYYNVTKRLLGPNHTDPFLNPDEVAPVLVMNKIRYNVENNWTASGLYPLTKLELGRKVEELHAQLCSSFEEHRESGFVFNGLNAAVSFWKGESEFFVHDSHSVDEKGVHSENGVGRIFSCRNVKDLAFFLLRNSPFDGNTRAYEVTRIKTMTIEGTMPVVVARRLDVKDSENAEVRNSTVTETSDFKLTKKPCVLLEDISEKLEEFGIVKNCVTVNSEVHTKKKGGRPPKKRRGRPKTSMLTKEEQHRVAVNKYTKKNPEVNRGAVQRYVEENPEVNSKAVKRYTQENPEVNRKAVRRYTQENPEINRKAVSRYTQENPEVNREAVKRYAQENPEVNREAVKRYAQENPEVNREAVKRYAQENPEVNREAVKRYKVANPGEHLPTSLRKGRLICERRGEELNEVESYRLKNPSLLSASAHKCPHCGAKLFYEERGREKWCCGQGKYNVVDFVPLTDPVYSDSQFLKHPRLYNDLFAFCALSVPLGYHHPKGLSFMKILGRTYHTFYDLNCEGPNNSYLYIDDGTARLMEGEKKKLNSQVIRKIHSFLESCNPYMSLYKKLHEEPSINARLEFEVTSRRKHGPVLGDRPTSTEVSAVLTCDESEPPRHKFCIWKKGSKPRIIDAKDSLMEPFQYPLLYPEGQAGWHIGRTDNSGKKLSQLKYTRCLLLSEDRFSRFGPLSETWTIDMYARIEGERLGYLQYMQKKAREQGGLRTGPMDEVRAAITDFERDETIQGEGGVVPGRVYLPQTFTGGPRYMKVAYLDAMALVSRFGGPTYFLTFTACGGWEEIKQSKHANSRHEAHLCNRVFELKMRELIRDIKSGKFFGPLAYIVWVIEFQMRGLPHVHICFRVADGGPKQNAEIDQVIRADIPDEKEAGGRLRKLVLQHMKHGPCGPPYRTDLPCWDQETQKCTKHFPKPHTDITYIDEKGFVHYKRNSANKAGIKFRGEIVETDDRWIVPYNAALLLKYECHANLEIASERRVVKYLFKYISKGSSLRRMTVQEENETDEVEEYVTKRYIGATDAVWRILEFDVTGRDPTVIHLPVHLDGKHNVVFRAGDEQDACDKSTSLQILYFGRPKHPDLDGLTYLDFYERYITHSRKPKSSLNPITHPDGRHFITKRMKGSCVARLFWVAPTRGEQYYLRMLLARYPAHSYQDLYELGGPECTTFQQAARALGLADDKKEYFEAMKEAAEFMVGNKLRQFFVLLSTIGSPVPDMWDKFKSKLCEDFLAHFEDDEEKAYKLGLIHIDRCLRRQGSSLQEAGLPVVKDNSTELGREILEYSAGVQKIFVEEWEPRLSPDQSRVLDYVKSAVENRAGSKVIFLDGPGGSGKTLLLRVISAYVRSHDKVVLCVASSGIAAQNLAGGTTAHSMFRLPLDIHGDRVWSITNGSQRAELIRESKLLIFDEAPMAHKKLIEMLDRSLKDLMRNDQLFGGKIVIFAGDFRQIPPIVEEAKTPSDIVRASLRSSYVWNKIKKFALTRVHRLSGEDQYRNFIMKIGSGTAEEIRTEEGKNAELLVPLHNIAHVKTVESLIDFVFPADIIRQPDESAKRVIICSLNNNVREINSRVLRTVAGEEQCLYSLDSVAEDDGSGADIDNSLLHQAQGKGIPEHVLKLKVGAVCMVTRNLNFDLGLVNGTKVIITAITRRLVTCRTPGSNEHFGIPRITFKFPIFAKSPIEMYRRQFPLQLCFAMTIHKSQGQTIDIVGLDLRSDCFTHGQLYVALSRVRSPNNIRVLVPPQRVIDGIPHTKNIVYKDLL